MPAEVMQLVCPACDVKERTDSDRGLGEHQGHEGAHCRPFPRPPAPKGMR